MSQFDAFAKASLAPFMTRTMGRTVAYTMHGKAAKTVQAILFQPPPEAAGTQRSGAQIIHALVSQADVPVVNKGGDKIQTADGAVYVVNNIIDAQSPGMWAVEATKESGRG